jgi:hypothetical protein
MGKRKTRIKTSRKVKREARRAQAKKNTGGMALMLLDRPTSSRWRRGGQLKNVTPWYRKDIERKKRKQRQKGRGRVSRKLRRRAKGKRSGK